MSAPDAQTFVFAGSPHPVSGGRTLELSACVPARGPRHRPVVTAAVDDDLVWVLPVPAVELAAARGAELESAFSEAELVDAAARAVAGYLDDLPDLPLLGEPFGGEEGTD